MYKVAILGGESSHANSFLKYIKAAPDVEAVGVFSEYEGAAEKLSAEFSVPVLKSFSELVGAVDGLIITARHGKDHYRFAKPYIKSGIPMFIDKPIVATEKEAFEFMRELKANDVRVSGGSSVVHDPWVHELREAVQTNKYGKTLGGYLRAPLNMHNEYGGFIFYAPHLVQTVQAIFGLYPESVLATPKGDVVNLRVSYGDFIVSADYVEHNYLYYAALSAEKCVKSGVIEVGEPCFETEFKNFYSILRGEPQAESYDEFMAPMLLMEAVARSMKSGREEPLTRFESV